MKLSKNVLFAAIVICFCLVLVFFVYLTFLSRVVVSIDNASILRITPMPDDLLNPNNAMISVSPTPNPPGVYSNGMHVQISGTGGDGLRIREFAGLNETPLYLGSEGEEFEIINGPEIYDSAIWWEIQSVENPSKKGWAVQDYLSQY